MSKELLLDDAYLAAKKANTAAAHGEAKEILQAKFPEVAWSEILEAYLKACELVDKCYEIGDAARREKIPDDRALEILRERFPGFSDGTYNDALTQGWFLSR
jgi:hypothetical protein